MARASSLSFLGFFIAFGSIFFGFLPAGSKESIFGNLPFTLFELTFESPLALTALLAFVLLVLGVVMNFLAACLATMGKKQLLKAGVSSGITCICYLAAAILYPTVFPEADLDTYGIALILMPAALIVSCLLQCGILLSIKRKART